LNAVAIGYLAQEDSTKNYNLIVKLFELGIFIRMLKLLSLLYEIKTTRIIIETISNLIKPLAYLFGVIMFIYYTFALAGMFFFGGYIKKYDPVIENDSLVPDYYHLMNFNDLLSSFVTLFALMMVNNWMVIVYLYEVVMGTSLVKIYFVLFYYFSVVIGINIAVAFAIDMYSSVLRLDEERIKTLGLLEKDPADKEEHKNSIIDYGLLTSPSGNSRKDPREAN
jgi:hypothetical protein